MTMRLLRFFAVAPFFAVIQYGNARTLSGHAGLCVIGCTPYVDPYRAKSMDKYLALVDEMARTCDVVVHVGDTKSGQAPCNQTHMTLAMHQLTDAAKQHQTMVLYALGDNEVNDCHRHQSAPPERRQPSEFVRAVDARQFLVQDLRMNSGKDLTGRYNVEQHIKDDYTCDFDKYAEFDDYAVATMEVVGSHWYLDDERFDNPGNPDQDKVDPLKSRLGLYVNAKDCAVDWIAETARRAHASGKRALFFLFHATFYQLNGVRPIPSGAIGEYYNRTNLARMTAALGNEVARPYFPLFDALRDTAFAYPDLMFQVVHSDAHRYLSTRLLPQLNNGPNRNRTHHNLFIQQVEGASRAVTQYVRFSVDRDRWQPITVHQEWSESAMKTWPYGHTYLPY